jgi:hypothetical protein
MEDITMHPPVAALEAFHRRELPAAEMLNLSDHLCACATCREQLKMLNEEAGAPAARSIAHFLGDDAALHLSEDEIAAAADDAALLTADAREHLSACRECQADVNESVRFAPRLQLVKPATPAPRRTRPRPEHWPAWTLATAAGLAIMFFAGHALLDHGRAPTQLVAELRDGGGEIGLTAQGQLVGVSALSDDDAALLTATLRAHRLPTPAAPQAVNSAPEIMRGAADSQPAFALLTPLAETTLQTPQLRWQSVPGATSYRVSIYDQTFQLAAESPTLTQPEWIVTQPLTPGETYTWVVKAATPAGTVQSPRPPAPEARFTVADAATASHIAAAQKANPSSHLLLAALYARYGMTTLEREQVIILEHQNSGSAIVEGLAGSMPPAAP